MVLTVGAERNRIIDRDELKKTRAANLREGPTGKLLDGVPFPRSARNKAESAHEDTTD